MFKVCTVKHEKHTTLGLKPTTFIFQGNPLQRKAQLLIVVLPSGSLPTCWLEFLVWASLCPKSAFNLLERFVVL